ncbi:MAG: response regulator [Deltaproteobacteria bacterium]|nr:response regulator [Deltaproteobacteria bacterium]
MTNIRVLLVDDEEQFTSLLAQRLAARGFIAFTAASGDEALARLDQEEVDVIVLDLFMPGKSGIDTLQEIKRVKPLTEVIMLTGHATVEMAIKGMTLGAFDFLIKPTETEDLVEKITKAYKRKAEQQDRIRQAEVAGILKSKGW